MDKNTIRAAAVEMANERGMINLTRVDLCERVGIKDGSFFGVAECSFGELLDEIKDEVPLTVDGVALTRDRLSPELRRDHLLSVAMEMAEDSAGGYQSVKIKNLAERAGVSNGLVSAYFNSVQNLHRAILRKAVSEENYGIIAQGLINRDPIALEVPADIKEVAMQRVALDMIGG